MFSDGSVKAFGAVFYIRWKLESGSWWSTLVMSKSKIGPKNRVSIPRMELDGAVLAKRLREFILETLNLRFANVYDVSDWPIKKTVRTDKLEGELVSKSNFCSS